MRYVLIVAVCLLGMGECELFDRLERPADVAAGMDFEVLRARVAILEQTQADSRRAEQRVVDLPEDGNQWHTVLLLRAGWQQLRDERRAESLFHSEPFFLSLKAQTHFHLYTSDSKEFERFRPLVDATPCLLIERANGEVVYRESGPRLARHPKTLACAVTKEIQRRCPDGRCLPLHPVPNEPAPVDEIPAVIQHEEEPDKPRRHSTSAMVALFVAAIGAGFVWKFRRAVH